MSVKILNTALDIAFEAGDILRNYYGEKGKTKIKFDKSVVTEADLSVDSFITKRLEEVFPTHSILSEESGKKTRKSDYLWVIDPLDGSTNFSVQNPFFAVSIGLLLKQQPLLGVVYSPIQKEVFYAEKNCGAFLIHNLKEKQKITINREATMQKSFIAFDNGRDLSSREKMIKIYSLLKMQNNVIRQVGAAALELCYVATGRYGAFIMPGTNPWDVIAGALIVKEANGLVTDFYNKEFCLESSDIIASTPSIHPQLLKIVG
ncbi:MAG: inositol monophosphatase family protein [Candidatus Hodarchaeales archaeon]|jgi:myo-inositol-1(or 4)-monophosphatase